MQYCFHSFSLTGFCIAEETAGEDLAADSTGVGTEDNGIQTDENTTVNTSE